jgi:hypothetical protein
MDHQGDQATSVWNDIQVLLDAMGRLHARTGLLYFAHQKIAWEHWLAMVDDNRRAEWGGPPSVGRGALEA